MPAIRITCNLPYALVLPAGEYPTPGEGGSVRLVEVSVPMDDGTAQARTQTSSIFDASTTEAQQRQVRAQADCLLRRVNHLLRWYRVTTSHATIVELTRAQASPFRFTVEGTDTAWGGAVPLEYEAPSLPMPTKGSATAFGDAVRKGLAGKTDPDVATLNLLDAEYALNVGRFREAVLLCWGAIDSTFVRKFKKLVDDSLTSEWASQSPSPSGNLLS
ncbi:MAG: hypothetical protein JWL69_4280 [Phycisphaerales bacterium]|nr:hypothetical protein [Phycisphaerales bacterium]